MDILAVAAGAAAYVGATKVCPFPKCKVQLTDGDQFLIHLKSEHPQYNPQPGTLFGFKCFKCTKCRSIKKLIERNNGERVLCVQCVSTVQQEDAQTEGNISMPGPSYTESISISWTVTAGGKDITQVLTHCNICRWLYIVAV